MYLRKNIANLVKYSTKPNIKYTYMAEQLCVRRSDAVQSAIEFLKTGAVIAVPTDTLYGLACDATNAQAIQNLYDVKCRSENKPVAICLSEVSDVQFWAHIKHLPDSLLTCLLPGPLTIILNSRNELDISLCYKGKVGIRIPDYNFVRKLVFGLGKPLALTSANLSNQSSTIRTSEFKSIWEKIPAVFEGGATHTNRSGSTIVDLSVPGTFQVIRKGVGYEETVNTLKKFGLRKQR